VWWRLCRASCSEGSPEVPPERTPSDDDLFDKLRQRWQNTLQSEAAGATHRQGVGVKKHREVEHPNCADKMLFAFQVNCTGQSLKYTLILSIEGEPDVGRLIGAILSTSEAHARLMTTVRGGFFRHYRQVHDSYVGEVLEVQNLSALQEQQGSTKADIGTLYERCIHEWINRPLDTRKSFPFRVLLIKKDSDQSALAFTFHHPAVDGVRALRLMDEIVSRYHNRPPVASLQPSDRRTSGRGDVLLGQARSERAKTDHFYRDMLSHLFHYVFINPLFHPARIFHDRAEPSGEVQFCSARMGPAELQRLKAKSNSVGGTVNDILMAACFRSTAQWNRQHGKRTRKISLLVPVDVGSPDLNGIICNQISYISFSASARDRTDPTRLLRKVTSGRVRMLKERRGNIYSILYFAHFLSRLPLVAVSVLSKYVLFPLYAETVICTNPGVVRFGDCGEAAVEQGGFRVTDLEVAPFVFSVMGMNICAITFNGSLGIYIAYDTGRFSKGKAEEFLALCMDELANYQVNPAQP
jgi:NRPS condensation-like uncharacterized protein